MSERDNRPKWHVKAEYGNKGIEFYAETTDEVIAILLRWIRRVVPYDEWPFILKWVEGIEK